MEKYDIIKTLTERKSCRKFKRCIIDNVDLELLYWAANIAPYASGGPRRLIYTITEKRQKSKLMEACMNQAYVAECSVIVIFCATDMDAKLRQGYSKGIFDCANACMCMDLMAVSMGYSTCHIGNFIPQKITESIISAEKYVPIIILLIGIREEI